MDPLKKDETVPGGAFQDADGNWIDAEGKPLEGDALDAAEAQASRRTTADKASFRTEQKRRAAAGQTALPEPVANEEQASPSKATTPASKPER